MLFLLLCPVLPKILPSRDIACYLVFCTSYVQYITKYLEILVQDDSSFLLDVFTAVKEELPYLSEKVKPHYFEHEILARGIKEDK